jgi:hypothetical protein
MNRLTSPSSLDTHRLLFASLSPLEESCMFPCDQCGNVDLNSLNDSERTHYLYARVIAGNSLAIPQVLHPLRDWCANDDLFAPTDGSAL